MPPNKLSFRLSKLPNYNPAAFPSLPNLNSAVFPSMINVLRRTRLNCKLPNYDLADLKSTES